MPTIRRLADIQIGAETQTTELPVAPPPPEQVLPLLSADDDYRGSRISARCSARRIISQVRRMTHQRRLSAATRLYFDKTVQRRLGRTGLDLARTHIASGWFFTAMEKPTNHPRRRRRDPVTALPTPTGSPDYPPIASANISKADHFEAVALSPKVTGYDPPSRRSGLPDPT